MKTTMSIGGIGPRLALLCLPYVILSLAVMYRDPAFLAMRFTELLLFRVIGFTWLALGVFFWIYSALYFVKYFKSGKLITTGPFSICRNPIYASIIIFIVPSLAVIFRSGLVLSIALVLFIGFKISIHGENSVLRRIFGKEYERYENSVNEIIPFIKIKNHNHAK